MSPFSDALYSRAGCRRALTCIRAWALTAAIVLSWPGLGYAAPASQSDHADPRAAAIRSAFLRLDPAELVRLFPETDRVYVELPRYGIDGFFGPGSLRALLDRLARESRTQSFEMLPSDVPPAAPAADREFFKARWRYVETSTGFTREQSLYLALRQFPGEPAWRIVELKAKR